MKSKINSYTNKTNIWSTTVSYFYQTIYTVDRYFFYQTIYTVAKQTQTKKTQMNYRIRNRLVLTCPNINSLKIDINLTTVLMLFNERHSSSDWVQSSRKDFVPWAANSFLEEVTLLRKEAKKGKIVELLHLKVYPFT